MLAGLVGILAGAGVGYLVSTKLSRFTGGSCPITCNPRISVPYFAFIGLLIAIEFIR